MKFKKTFCLFLSVMMLISVFSAVAVSANAESGMPDAAFGGGQPPEKPDGEMPGEPPEGMGGPGGGMGTPPDGAPGGDMGTPPDGGMGGPGGMPGGGPGSGSDIDYSGAVEITSADSQESLTYETSAVDQSALLISTAEDVTVTNPTVVKSGSSDGGDSCNFYGLNAAVLVKDGSKGDGTTVIIRDTVINTTGSGSGGIMTTGGGTTYAYDLTVTTSGGSSAPIRTDRGGGTVHVDGGSYTSNGLGSPAIYSTADITVENAALTSNLSEGVCIEGKNSITLLNCDLSASNTKCNGNATFLDTIMIYQSMSGDADSGTSSFTMTGGSLTSKNGHVFHVTNTNAVINLSGVEIRNEDASDVLLSVCDDGWNGAGNVATLNADGQALSGTILVGSNSSLTLNLMNGSTLTGTVSGEIVNAKGATVSTEAGTVDVTLDSTSTWSLTGDTYVSSFSGDTANISFNGYTLYVDGAAVNP